MAELEPPDPSKQIAFHQLLVAARTTILHGALADALGAADPRIVARELGGLLLRPLGGSWPRPVFVTSMSL